MITDPFFYLAAVPAVFLVGLSKGGFGGTIALIGVPLMALVISPVAAAGILLPIMIVMDLIALYAWRGRFDRDLLKRMLPASVVGVAAGYFTSASISADGVRIVVGLLALGFAVNWYFSARHRTEASRRSTPRALFWGAASGFTSFVSHAGGPPFQIHVVPLKLAPADYAGTAVVFFAVTNAVKLLPYFLLGQFSADHLAISLALLPIAPVATLCGVWLVKRIAPETFYRIIYALLVPVGLKLAYDGFAGIAG
ncbi:MAG: sulfite exporter TauE/SafE family protein [Pseudomonadota bacterium]|nr:sulfite exporter TauE/SafE family protein [Pseudomonadota bacterium]